MTKQLKQWLWRNWIKNNPENPGYFKIWADSLTENQIRYYESILNREKK